VCEECLLSWSNKLGALEVVAFTTGLRPFVTVLPRSLSSRVYISEIHKYLRDGMMGTTGTGRTRCGLFSGFHYCLI
jgi:hypothetical protein